MLSKCGEQYRRRYIEGERIPPGVALIVGRGVDKSVEKNLQHKIDSQELLTLEEVKDAARDTVTHDWHGDVALSEEERAEGIKTVKAKAIDKAVRLAGLHAEETAPHLSPTAVNRSWRVELNGYPMDLTGVIDVQESNSVRDTKTSGRTPNEACAHESDQLTAYALARRIIDKQLPEFVALDYLIDKGKPEAKTFVSVRTEDDLRVFYRRVQKAIKVIETGVFMPARQTDWWCSQRWCGYATTCPYFRRPVSISLAATGETK